ncbi:hypothetical protein J1G42_07195 [Cellulomonas sp. zg-ZUI222]|uniref:PsbP C-terminal domain-containing protein n=1 Tax=Cellulomonas wangleii TaxID=2816956 RepID=A0ABX8D1N3_9CELL|nr:MULTISPECIES: hypothetical protein [Cellulomonas]MBO0899747.1 hypothetical protein [Cellulomonas sp. zg-ZUI22]MBO0920609.1 hypothetical protein [Cellulomonas wangleii]MBO0922973.1 hypothetical protein [Cellulomonas wangleii]QVI61363.1 hypothetical protein KG103_12845 [Cellulomonas wangleii]
MKSPRVLALAILPLVLAACGTSEASTGAPLVPADPPAGWESHAMGPVTLAAPADWEEFETQPGDRADEAFALRAAGEGPGTGVHTSVTSQRTRDAAAAIENLGSVGDASVGAEDVEQAELTWPGAEAAGWIGYRATVTVGSEDVEMRYEYLVVDLEDDAQAIVAVVAPADTFDESGAHDVLASVTVG